MKLLQALKTRLNEESKHEETDKKPSLLDVLRERDRDSKFRERRRVLLKRIGKR